MFLPPHKARKVIAAASVYHRAGIKGKIASDLQNTLLSRKALLVGVPLLAIAVFAIYVRPTQPIRAAEPVPVASVLEAPGVTATQPAAMAEKKIDAPSNVSGSPAARVVPTEKITPAPAALAQAKSTLTLAISPWGEVFIDGKSMGVSPPLNSLQLEAGRHTVEIRNKAFAGYRDTVQVKPGQSLKIKHKFR